MRLKCKEIVKDIYQISFSSRKELTRTFLRFEEYFESPKFRGKIFSLNEFKKWYTANSPEGKKTKRFTYYEDWHGFNIPSEILGPFYGGRFNPLSNEEKAVLRLFKNKRKKKLYIIATYKGASQNTIQHEIAHGLFYTNSEYKREIIKILRKCDQKIKNKIINNYLSKYGGGYHPKVWLDEMHTYIMTNLDFLKKYKISSNKLLKTNKELNNTFKKYVKG